MHYASVMLSGLHGSEKTLTSVYIHLQNAIKKDGEKWQYKNCLK